MRHIRNLLLLISAALLGACASGPQFNTERYHMIPLPKQVTADQHQKQRYLWGGTIVDTRNLANGTRLEVLAYPLKRNQRPDTDGPAGGRFLVIHPGYLEPVDYAPGRQVTVSGLYASTETGKVGQAEYRYPVLEAEGLYLWPEGRDSEPTLQFGIGIGISR